MSLNNSWLEYRRAERRAHRQAQLKRDGITLIAICSIAALIVLAIMLSGCASDTVNLCDPAVSFMQVGDTTLDAYRNGVIVARNVTIDMIAAACGGK